MSGGPQYGVGIVAGEVAAGGAEGGGGHGDDDDDDDDDDDGEWSAANGRDGATTMM